jgi:LysM repeat protein
MEDGNSARAGREPARLAAPLALLAALIAVVVVIQASGPSSSSRSPAVARTAVHHPAPRHKAPPPSNYVVQQGDTLSDIAAKMHVSLETIQRLNPNLDPQALQAGQRLKLSP